MEMPRLPKPSESSLSRLNSPKTIYCHFRELSKNFMASKRRGTRRRSSCSEKRRTMRCLLSGAATAVGASWSSTAPPWSRRPSRAT